MSTKVSIVVPIYNGEKYIENCVNNLLSQTYDNLEFILVDDGSTDDSGAICDKYARMDSRFIVIHQDNVGLSAARNAGTAKATGEYIFYYDVDDDIADNLVEDNLRLAKENDADVVVFSFWYYNVDKKEKIANTYYYDFCGTGEEFFHNCLCKTIDKEVFNAPWNKLYRLSFIKENQLSFLPEYPIYEDIIFAADMLKHVRKIIVNSGRYYIYHVRSSGSLITKYVDGYFDSVTKFYDNAMNYCSLYDDNEKQIRRFSEVYVRLVTTNLKQISCKKDIPKQQRLALIEAICENDKFLKALSDARLEFRKMFVKFFTIHRMPSAIYSMYNFLTLLR